MEDISRYIVLPYESKDYGPFLQVMHAMWPEFTFTDQDLARKDMIYAGELSRWGVWEGNELLSCCNLYMRPEEFFVSWFYRPDSSGGISAIRVLISHILEKAYVDEAEITSRVLGSHPLWPILQSFGFFPRKSIVDWVLDIEQRGGITDITVSEPESSYFSLDQCRNDMRILRQIYELELDYVGKVPPWFTFQVFYRNLLSIPTLNTSASTVLLQDGRVQAYALVLRNHRGENKIRKIIAREYYYDLIAQMIKRVSSFSATENQKRIWISTDDRNILGHWISSFGFAPAYTWLNVVRSVKCTRN